MDQKNVLLKPELPSLKLLGRGKVRENYDLGDHMLMVATDRLSAFDVVLPQGIPDKGAVLTGLSVFWFGLLRDVVGTHFVTADVAKMPGDVQKYASVLRGRSMLVRKLAIVPFECVVRGYLAGSGWSDYTRTGSISGIRLPAGLRESDKLPEPVFTPSTKATVGHDENVTFETVKENLGAEMATRLRDLSLKVYLKAADYARSRGIILCDTKFEWGQTPKGELVLADEVLTPDSSRFWPVDGYAPGKAQPSFDKQFVRDYLISIKWNKQPPPPDLPAEIVAKTSERYLEAYKRLTGKALKD
ncbi:MAG: phosphoribosylaminoimidazolesuccinocarboxamide synthase [Planctomycetota bacterium]|nr:phosphoribosylaminoimidazolesuccinocarboxamide synthase [Planctomycetota bacterium]